MATQTKNYKFKKPDRKEFFNVADLNDNLDAIDGVLGGKQEAEVKDTNNILGAGPGKKALIQTLFDSIGDWFINKLVTNDNFVAKFSERLVNNGTANLEGFALDARQGNPTVPGSMAKQISELNSQKANVFRSVDISTGVNIPIRTYSISLIAIGHPPHYSSVLVAISTLGFDNWSDSMISQLCGSLTDVGCEITFSRPGYLYLKSSKPVMWALALN